VKHKQSRQQRASLKARGIRPAPKKATAQNPKGQATGGWSPFAPPAGQQDIADDVEYEAYDRVKRGWFTHKPKGQ
jgi:hypothetical protein